ncbi:MAG TPA: hypothetical protein VD927_04315 [Chryseosolibacter sp.]|nr:hypothetical protein [Chryseosolibacter sp.]
MKVTLSIVFIFCLSVAGYAQRLEVTASPVVDARQLRKDVGGFKTFFSAAFKGFSYSSTLFFNTQKKLTYTGFGFKDKAFNFSIAKDYLTYTGVKKLSAESIDEKVTLNAFITLGEKMYVIYSQKFTERDEFSVYVNEVSADMVILGSPLILQNFKNLKQYGMDLSVVSSEDKKFILISRFYDTKAKEKQKIECKVVDQSFSEIWYKMIECDHMDKEVDVKAIDLDNAGNLYMLMEFEVGKVNMPMLYSYYWKSKSLKSDSFGPKEGENFGTRLTLLNGDKPYMVGLNENEKNVKYFIAKVNTQTQAIENLGVSAMPEDFYKASKVRAFDTKDWRISDMVSLSNNSIVASVEAILVDTKYHIHHSYNAYVLSFKEDGSPNWTKTVQKKQVAMQGLSGHILVPAGDKVLVIYNDDKENLSKKPTDSKVEPFNSKNAMIVVQEMDAAGKVTKYPFSKDSKLQGYALYFNYMARIEKDFYYSSCINVKGALSLDTKNITFKVKY